MRVIAALHSLASMVEGVAMVLLAVSDAVIERASMFGGLIILVGGSFAIWSLFLRPYILVERMRSALGCTTEEAKTINDYLAEVSVSWLTFYEWLHGATNKFMPMMFFDTGKNDQLFAHWSEVRNALTKLALDRKIDPKWKKADAIAAIGLEIMMQRRADGRNLFDPDGEPVKLAR